MNESDVKKVSKSIFLDIKEISKHKVIKNNGYEYSVLVIQIDKFEDLVLKYGLKLDDLKDKVSLFTEVTNA